MISSVPICTCIQIHPEIHFAKPDHNQQTPVAIKTLFNHPHHQNKMGRSFFPADVHWKVTHFLFWPPTLINYSKYQTTPSIVYSYPCWGPKHNNSTSPIFPVSFYHRKGACQAVNSHKTWYHSQEGKETSNTGPSVLTNRREMSRAHRMLVLPTELRENRYLFGSFCHKESLLWTIRMWVQEMR